MCYWSIVCCNCLQAIVVRWEAPQEDAQNGIIIGYKIRYKQRTEGVAGLGGGGGRGETVTTDGTRRMYELKGRMSVAFKRGLMCISSVVETFSGSRVIAYQATPTVKL